MPVSNVPENVTFGKKILVIPSLKEMGVPEFIGGLGYLKLATDLEEYRYFGKWIKRGDKLLKYRFNKHLTFNFKLAQTVYFDETPIRSGSVKGDRITDFKVLIKYVL